MRSGVQGTSLYDASAHVSALWRLAVGIAVQ